MSSHDHSQVDESRRRPAAPKRPDGPDAGPAAGSLRWLASAAGNRAFGQALHGGSPLVAQREPGGSVETTDGTESIEGSTIRAGHGDYFDKVRTTMGLVSTRLAANAGNYGVQVLNACESFKHYADEKVHALEGEVTGEKLAGMLVSAALGPVGGLTEHVANAALKFVADKVVDLVKDKLTEGAKKAVGNGDSASALKASIEEIVQGSRDASTGVGVRAQAALDGRLRGLFQRCEEQQELTAEDNDLVGPFWDVPPSTVDEQVERQFGIPSAAGAGVAQVEIFNALVEEFEKLYINKSATWEENFEMANQEMIGDWNLSLPGKARTAASTASGGRAGALGVTWESFARAGREYEEARRMGVRVPAPDVYEHARQAAEFGE